MLIISFSNMINFLKDFQSVLAAIKKSKIPDSTSGFPTPPNSDIFSPSNLSDVSSGSSSPVFPDNIKNGKFILIKIT